MLYMRMQNFIYKAWSHGFRYYLVYIHSCFLLRICYARVSSNLSLSANKLAHAELVNAGFYFFLLNLIVDLYIVYEYGLYSRKLYVSGIIDNSILCVNQGEGCAPMCCCVGANAKII